MNTEEHNKILEERIRELEQEHLEAKQLAEEKKQAQFERRAKWFWVLLIGAIFIWAGFSDSGILRETFLKDKSADESAKSAHNCRGTANSYVSPFDRKTYTYTCNNSTGVWAYTDRFNDPSCQLIKGNIAFETGEKIYHVKGQTYYDDTGIDLDYGERWFCSESEAASAGWRRAKN